MNMPPKGVAGVKYTTGIELRDEGQFGFLLPEDQGSTEWGFELEM